MKYDESNENNENNLVDCVEDNLQSEKESTYISNELFEEANDVSATAEASIVSKEKIGYKVILKQTEFMKTVIAALINRFGDSVDSIAFTWLVYQVTQSATWSAIIFGINRIPTIFLQPFAGAMIEGLNKKRVMIITDVIRGLSVGFIATAMIAGFLNQWMLLGSTIVISCAEAFRGPASTSLIPKLLEDKYYEFGLSLSSSSSSIMELIGLGFAGVIIATFGISTAIYIDAATFFISALIIMTLRVREKKEKHGSLNVKTYLDTLKGGFLYIRGHKIITYFIFLGVFLNAILVPFNSLQAPLISEVLHSSELMLSVIGVAITTGMIIGSVCYPYLSKQLKKGTLLRISSAAIAIYYFSLVLAGRFLTSNILLYVAVSFASFLVGLCIAMLNSMASVELMKNIDEHYLARVGALFNAGCVAAIPVVSFIISGLTKFLSTSVLFIIAGICGVFTVILLFTPKKMKELGLNSKG